MIVWLCGVCRGSRRVVGDRRLAAHPGAFSAMRTLEPAAGDLRRLRRLGPATVFRGSLDELSVRMGDDAWIEARFRPSGPVAAPRSRRARARAASFPGSRSTGIPCCSRPSRGRGLHRRPAAAARGRPRLCGEELGPRVRGRWWWGQADAFPHTDVGVAFAGGRLPSARCEPGPDSGGTFGWASSVLRFVPPLARARVSRRRARLARPGASPTAIGSSSRARQAGRSRTGCLCPTWQRASSGFPLAAGAGGPALRLRRPDRGTADARRRRLAAGRSRVRRPPRAHGEEASHAPDPA